jgi:uncharacterized membrane protein
MRTVERAGGRRARLPALAGAADATLRRIVGLACIAAVAAQLAVLLAWSRHLAARASLSVDFATYYQAWYEVAHGDLLARTSLHAGGFPFLQNDGELLVYLLAPLYWVFPDHIVGLLWLQDLCCRPA